MENTVKIYKRMKEDRNRLEYVCELNYSFNEFLPEFFAEWNDEEHLYSSEFYSNAICNDDNSVRAMTHEEEFRYGLAGLYDGEYLENDKIKTRPVPEGLYKPEWNPSTTQWGEGVTLEELRGMIKEKENKMIEIKNNIKEREEMDFDTDDEKAELEAVKLERKKLKDDLLRIFKVNK